MSQSYTYPRSRAVTALTDIDILADFGAPIQMLQNVGATDANVTFNGGTAAFVIKASETLIFRNPILGVINSDQSLIALA